MTPALRALRARDPLADPAPLIERVYGYAAYRLGHGPDAEDATSEAFARALRYRDSYDPARGTPIGWLIGIARRCVDETLRARRPLDVPTALAAEGDMAGDVVDRVTLAAAVAALGGRDRELIALRYGADLAPREIGARLQLSANAVEVALHRARARLRALLEEPPAGERVVAIVHHPVRSSPISR